MNFREWLRLKEMWFNDKQVQTKRKTNKNLEGTALPKSLAPQPPNAVPGSKMAGPNGGGSRPTSG